MGTPEQGARLAEGVFGYSVDDRPHASEAWRLTRGPDDRLYLQTLLGSGQQVLCGMDLTLAPDGAIETLDARLNERGSERTAHLTFTGGAARGQISAQGQTQPVELSLPPGTVLCPESIAMRFLIGRALDLTPDAEQTLPLCLVPIRDDPQRSLVPQIAQARATVLGIEPVELLMATVQATRVLIETPDAPPQHAWFDERRFPVQWYWIAPGPAGAEAAHEFSLTRYAWHENV